MVVINLKERFKNGELDLSSCGLKEIPKEVNSLKHITSLNLSNNKINHVGKIIGNLTYLNKLDLSRNSIKGISENIGNLHNLKHLNLSHNQLATLPASIGNLSNLKYLNLKNNHLAQKFAEIVGSCQNDTQCQQAAKNVKILSTQVDNDKKKPNAEPEAKKKKNEKKVQNGNVNQPSKSNKDRKTNKKPRKGVFGTIFGLLCSFLKLVIMTILIIGMSGYILSFYDESLYSAIQSQLYLHWHRLATSVFTDEQTAYAEGILLTTGQYLNQATIRSRNMILLKSKEFYVYITTDETIQKYVNNAKIQAQDLWLRMSGGSNLTTEQKHKS